MATGPVSDQMGALRRQLEPLLDFILNSAYAMRAGDPEISDLVLGNPHDAPLPEVTEAIRRRSVPENKDWFAYKMNDERAVAVAAETLSATRGVAFEPADVFLTTGTFGAISVALRTVVDPGDEVIFLSPPWFFYEPMIQIAGATPVRVTLRAPGFDLDLDAIAAAVTPRTRAILVNTPNNPTGRIYPREQLEALARLLADAAARHGRRIFLLSDESYYRVAFDGRHVPSPAAVYPDTLLLYTYGKQLLAPGQRLGYVALPSTMGDREAVRDIMMLSQVVGGWQFPNAVMQYALPDLEDVTIDIDRLQRRRDRVVGALREMGYEPNTPEGTFYVLVRSPIEDDRAFTDLLAEYDVFVGPGQIFEVPGYVRISLTANDDMVERALPGFEKALARLRGS